MKIFYICAVLVVLLGSVLFAENTGDTIETLDFVNIARGKQVKVSSILSGGQTGDKAIDGDNFTSWCSNEQNEPQWLYIDLGKVHQISGVTLKWDEDNYAKHYKLAFSIDGEQWKFAFERENAFGGSEILTGETETRFIGLYCLEKDNNTYYALKEIEVYSKVKSTGTVIQY